MARDRERERERMKWNETENWRNQDRHGNAQPQTKSQGPMTNEWAEQIVSSPFVIHYNIPLIYEWITCRNESIYMWKNSSDAHANVRFIGWTHSTWTCCINRIEVEQQHSVFFPLSSSSKSFLLIYFTVLGRISMAYVIHASLIRSYSIKSCSENLILFHKNSIRSSK